MRSKTTSDSVQEYIYVMGSETLSIGSETLSSVCHILSEKPIIPFNSTSKIYKNVVLLYKHLQLR